MNGHVSHLRTVVEQTRRRLCGEAMSHFSKCTPVAEAQLRPRQHCSTGLEESMEYVTYGSAA